MREEYVCLFLRYLLTVASLRADPGAALMMGKSPMVVAAAV